MANTVRLESGWLFRQLESAEQRASNLPYWLTSPGAPAPSERQASSVQSSKTSDSEPSN